MAAPPLLLALAIVLLPVFALAFVLTRRPVVPKELPSLESLPLPWLYVQLIRSALMRKPAPKPSLKMEEPITVSLAAPARFDAGRYAAFLKLAGYEASAVPRVAAGAGVPLTLPLVESFRLSMLAMAHPAFPFSVLGAVLARNSARALRPIPADEPLRYRVSIDPCMKRNDKGDTEIVITTTATAGWEDGDEQEVWRNDLTVIVINPKRARGAGAGAGAGGKAAAAAAPPARELLAELVLPADAGRRYGALTGDRNPIHLHAATARLFGFNKPIAHAMYLVARLEAALANADRGPPAGKFPLVFDTEFKRPTPLPATLRAVVSPAAKPPLQCAVLTGDGAKEVVVGRLYAA